MPPSSAADPLRTWTSHDQGPSGKWIFVFWLGLALVILLGTFFWWLNLPKPPKTFYVSMVIEDYGDRLPKPHYPVWSSEKIKKLQADRHIEPWTTFAEDLQSFDNLDKALNDLPGKLVNRGASTQDTLILQLRMHCKVTTSDDGNLKLGLVPGEKVSEFSFDNFLKALQKVPAKNVIVLADICDLDYAPQIGVIANPIASSLLQLCQSTKAPSGPNIWILCAGRDLDANYVSHLRQRTLLQSACESALSKATDQDSEGLTNTISLAEFYRQVWAYCRRASEIPSASLRENGESAQLPLLMRVGDGRLCEYSETPSDTWKLATQVHVAHFLKASKPKPKEEEDEKSKELAEPAVSAGKSNAVVNDPILNCWKLRDVLTSSASWSPAQFAPHHWQEYQLQFARRQFDVDASDSVKIDLQLLQKLIDEIKSPSNSSDVDVSQPLLKAYRDFLKDPTLDAARQTWQRNDLIVQSAEEWEILKAKYRKYAEACASIPAWAHWYRHELTRYGGDVRNFDEFASALIELHNALPKENQGILDYDATFDTTKLDRCVQELRQMLAERCSDLDRTCFQKKTPKLTWHEEHQLQRLLETPLLDAERRQDLWLKWRSLFANGKPRDHATEPDESFQQTSFSEVHHADIGRFDATITKWIDVVGKLAQLANVTGVNLQANWNASKGPQGPDWSILETRILQASPAGSFPQDKRLHEWHVRCLSGLLPDKPKANFSAGIVLPASLSRALQVSVTPKGIIRFGEKDQTEVTLIVQFRDSTPINEVWLYWRLQNALNDNAENYLTIAHAGMPISSDPNDPTHIKINSDRTINLKLTSHELSQSLKAPLPVELLIREKGFDKPVPLALSVVPTQPNQVDLRVQRIVGGQPQSIESDTPDGFPSLDCVAAAGARSYFRFGLINRSSQAKSCVVTVHPLPLTIMKAGPPQPDSLRDIRKKWPAIAKATASLPAAEVGNEHVTILELAPVKAEPVKAEPVVPSPEYGWFYFHIQEVDAEGKELTKSHAAYCRLEGINPILAKLLDITPSITKQGYKMWIKPNQAAWQEHGLDSLKVKTDVYAADGKFVREIPTINLMDGAGQEVSSQLDSDAVLHFYLTVGGYPRAATYTSDDTSPAVPSIAHIKSVQAFTTGPNSRMIPANKDGVFPAIDPQEQIINYAGIRLTAQIDVRDYAIHLVNSNDSSVSVLRGRARRMDFKWETLESGDMAMEVTASDIEATLEIPNGRFTLQIKLPDGRLISKEQYPVIFDQDKPEPIEYYVGGKRVRTSDSLFAVNDGEDFVFEAVARDSGSGINRLELAINSPSQLQAIYDDQDIKLNTTPNQNKNSTWSCRIKPAEYKGLGTFTIVARSEDNAMNVEKSHPVLKVNIRQAPKPSKPEEEAK